MTQREEINQTIKMLDLFGSSGHSHGAKLAAFNAATALKELDVALLKDEIERGDARLKQLAEEIKRRQK